jgi:hypothetical protein
MVGPHQGAASRAIEAFLENELLVENENPVYTGCSLCMSSTSTSCKSRIYYSDSFKIKLEAEDVPADRRVIVVKQVRSHYNVAFVAHSNKDTAAIHARLQKPVFRLAFSLKNFL